MSKRSSRGSGFVIGDGLDVHLAEFLATLAPAGYAKTTQQDKRRLVVPFVRWAHGARLTVADLDEGRVRAFLARRSRRRCKRDDMERATLHQFLEHLRAVGVVPPRQPSEPSPSERLVRKYVDHLRSSRGLCTRSVEVYLPFVRGFVAERRLPERVASLDASAVRGYLLDRSRNERRHEDGGESDRDV